MVPVLRGGGRGRSNLKWCRELQVPSAAPSARPVENVPQPRLLLHPSFAQDFAQEVNRKQKMPEKEDQEKQFGGFSFLCGYLPFLFWSVCVLVVCMCVHIWVCTWWRVCARALVCAWMQGVGIGVSVIALHVSLLQLSLCCCAETLTKTSFGEEIKAGAQDGNLKQEPRRDATL